MPTLATNKKVLHDYKVIEEFEAGISLTGPEVKSIKNGQINLKGSYISPDNKNQIWLVNANIAVYKPAIATQGKYQPTMRRKLLLHQKEINYLSGKSRERGLTILPISVYTKGSLIKLKIGLAKGKKEYDKRESIKKRELDREIRRKLKKS